ncbi:MAG: RND family transporter, partial [Nevskiales bacterium]
MQALENVIVSYARWLIRWRWLVLVGMLGLTVAIGSGMRLIEFSTSYRIFFGPDNPQLQAFDATEKIYSKADNVFFGIESKSGDPFNADVMTAVEQLTEAGWQLPYANRVDSITNFQHTEAEGDDLKVAPLMEGAESLPPQAFERAKQIALNDPLLNRQLIAHDGQMVGVSVTFQLPGESINETPEVVKAARDLRDEILAQYPDLNIY